MGAVRMIRDDLDRLSPRLLIRILNPIFLTYPHDSIIKKDRTSRKQQEHFEDLPHHFQGPHGYPHPFGNFLSINTIYAKAVGKYTQMDRGRSSKASSDIQILALPDAASLSFFFAFAWQFLQIPWKVRR